MPQDMLQYDEELLQRNVIVVQHTAMRQTRVYDLLNDQFGHV